MTIISRAAWLFAASFLLCCGPSYAQLKVKIGVLTDMSSVYADATGEGSVVAARLAIEDFDPKSHGMQVDLVSADHLNKADVGAALARRWFESEKVDAIVDVPNSSVALAVNEIAAEKGKMLLVASAATSDLTGVACKPTTIHWAFDTWAVAAGTARSIVQDGGKTWFFITADYAFGHALERDATTIIEREGGTVVGAARAPFNSPDFASFLIQAQASHADVIGLASSGADAANAIKQAGEFGLVDGGQRLAALNIFITDIHSLGLKVAQGLLFTESFYWDLNEKTRAWSQRFATRREGQMPTMDHAAVYAAVLHYLKAVEAAGTTEGQAVASKTRALPTKDDLFGIGEVRVDGRVIHDMYLFEATRPAESRGGWDYYRLLKTIPKDVAFRPLEEGNCPFVKR
jgi:branched-chain amino acid transport system substrate-binding protein